MAKPPYRTLLLLLVLGLMGGGVAFAHLEAGTYVAYLDLLKVLAGAQAIKAAAEHAANAFTPKAGGASPP